MVNAVWLFWVAKQHLTPGHMLRHKGRFTPIASDWTQNASDLCSVRSPAAVFGLIKQPHPSAWWCCSLLVTWITQTDQICIKFARANFILIRSRPCQPVWYDSLCVNLNVSYWKAEDASYHWSEWDAFSQTHLVWNGLYSSLSLSSKGHQYNMCVHRQMCPWQRLSPWLI